MTPETASRITILRAKIDAGEATLEEAREAVRILRGDRVGAAISSEKSRATKSRAKAEIKSADDMLSELGDI